jgi:hypothetical protein
MPDIETREGQWRPFAHWESLSAEAVRCNIDVGTNIAEYWRRVAEIHLSAVMAIAGPQETRPDRRRKFTVIEGGNA